MRLPLLLVVLLASAPSAQDDFYAEDLEVAESYLLQGRLSRAQNVFEEIDLANEEEPPEDRPTAGQLRAAHQGLLRIKLRRGGYDEIVKACEALP
ncbi:MAG: hypothetical protein QF412_11405, partial [Planctomycetota bacterium]|nr:hypothetical protein [Planctomycetota bacterium]